MLYEVTHCTEHVSANTRPHQLHGGDWEMGTAISCIECSHMAGLILKVVENLRKYHLFVQLFFRLKIVRSNPRTHTLFFVSHEHKVGVSVVLCPSCFMPLVTSFPGSNPVFHHLQYEKLGGGLVSFLT